MQKAALLVIFAILLFLSSNNVHAVPDGDYVKEITKAKSATEIKFNIPVEIAYAASTGSMKPTFDNDILLLTKPHELQIGDIVVYEQNGKLIVHRIVGIQTRADGIYYQLKGDNNFITDGWIRADTIKWKVIGILY